MAGTLSLPRPTELLMLGLSVFVLAALSAEMFLELSPDTRTILGWADFGICMVFMAEFFVRLARAEDRRAFLKWGWIDLVSSIPLLDGARWGRAVRIIRIMRMLRAVRSLRRIGAFLLHRRGEAVFSAAVLLTLLVVTFASIVILELEGAHPDAKIRVPADALWWSLSTITTVGYGDLYPVTGAGRAVAVSLMIVGIGLFGIYTGLVASWFLSPSQQEQAELARVRAQLDVITLTLQSLHPPHLAGPGILQREGNESGAPT